MKKIEHVGCPFNYALGVFGDKWSLLILRDIVIYGKKTYTEFSDSRECIATNVLADRLAKLEENGLITKMKDPQNRRSYLYQPREKALDLIPVLIEMICWSAKYDEISGVPKEYLRRANEERTGLIKEIRDGFTNVV